MKKTLILALALSGSFAATSCKKTWTCECKNANSTYAAGTIEDATRQRAKKTCKALSTQDTECTIK